MKILNFGSLNYDHVYQVEHIVTPGETIQSSGFQRFCGGKGLNQSIALARAGAEVWHAGLVGEDGEELIDVCAENGIHTEYIKKIAGKTGHTIIQVDSQGQNSIVLYGGSNQAFSKEYIDAVLDGFQAGDFLLLQNEINEPGYIIDRAFEKKMRILLNPSPYNSRIAACDLKKISVFFINEVEGRMETGKEDEKEILQVMKERYPDAAVVLTLGDKGAFYQSQDTTVWQEAYPVKTVDTTAAGDTFTGYFIAGLVDKLDIKETMKRSAMAAGLAVSRNGAAASIPYKKEIENR